MKHMTLIAAALLAAGAPVVRANTVSVNATDSAQVGTGGPKAAGFYNATDYMDVEGAANGNFATYGVLDFANVSPLYPVTGVSPDLTLTIPDSPFTYTAPGTVDFYLVTDNGVGTGTNLFPGGPLFYDTTQTANPVGLGGQLGTAYLLGQGIYTSTPNTPSSTLTYDLTLPGGAATDYLLGQLNDPDGAVRLAVTADASTPNVTASYGGASSGAGLFGQNDPGGPTLTLNVAVPEANTPALLLVGLLALAAVGVARRRKSA